MYTIILFAIIVTVLAASLLHQQSAGAITAHPFRRRPAPYRPSLSNTTPASSNRRKPEWVLEALLAIVAQAPQISCRNLKLRFDLTHTATGVSIGKTYAAKFLQQYLYVLANPKRHTHSIDTAGRLLQVWAMDITESRIVPAKPQPVLGLLDHASRQALSLSVLRDKGTIAVLRILLDAIEHYGKPRAIRTDNEAMFTSWIFAFALHWLGIRHQRTLPQSPWMNGRIERFWRTLKDALNLFDIPNEAELQATLGMLKHYYNHHRPHQSLSRLTPDQAAEILRLRAKKRSPRKR